MIQNNQLFLKNNNNIKIFHVQIQLYLSTFRTYYIII